MGASYLTYTLITLITFHSGHRERILFSGYTQRACEIRASEDNMNWKLYGDHTVFKNVKSLCITNGEAP